MPNDALNSELPDDEIVDLFAGPGGWSTALRWLGKRDLGLEIDKWACATRLAAGHATRQCDVSAVDPGEYVDRIDGLIASPPCQAFSLAGNQRGTKAIDKLYDHVIQTASQGWTAPEGVLVEDDVRADLTLQPLRWAYYLRPRWMAFEQVSGVRHLWKLMGDVFQTWGYSVWTGRLNSADYGVAQTRERAFLIARNDGIVARAPDPTHFDPRKGMTLFGEPWVNMAEALGWGFEDAPSPTVTGGGGEDSSGKAAYASAKHRARLSELKRAALEHGDPEFVNGNQENAARRTLDEPAPTIAFGHNAVNVGWEYPQMKGAGRTGQGDARDPQTDPAPTITGKGTAAWVHERPATTIVGSFRPEVVAAPGYRGAGDESRQDAPGSVSITVEEAALLQSFPVDYPWQGPVTAVRRQIGDAVPPLLAKHVLAQFF